MKRSFNDKLRDYENRIERLRSEAEEARDNEERYDEPDYEAMLENRRETREIMNRRTV